jgi:predicted MFS family arabinose efflux permease
MTRFVLAIWLWDRTGEATALVLVDVFAGISSLLANFAAGPLIDRLSRKSVIILPDLLAGLTTVALLLLADAGQLAPAHLFCFGAVWGFRHISFLAFSTSITLLIPKEQYTPTVCCRSPSTARLLARRCWRDAHRAGRDRRADALDVATFLFAITTVSLVSIPRIVGSAGEPESGWAEILFGIRYIFSRPPLRGLLLVMFAFSLFESFGYPLVAPMILARTGGDEVILGPVQSVLGVGGIIGGAAVAVWGGFRKKIHGVLTGLLLTGLLGDALTGLGAGLLIWLPAAIFIELFIPLAISSNNAIWQAKVLPQQQGRVFAARSLISGLGEPVALLCTGLLADRVFEPAMRSGGALAPLLGPLIGTGPGAGMAILLVVCGVLCAAVALWGYLVQPIREIETILPDHEHSTNLS